MTHLKEGDKAPLFDKIISGKNLKKGKIVLYFYPKDNTPGCTAEACSLKDNYNELQTKGFEVIGVSADSEKSHENFKTKYELPFHLISDTEKEILEAYGVWGEKKMYGKSYFGVHRLTFIINQDGIIEKIFTKVETKTHANQILSL